jgi:hypothetical protein
MFFFVVKKRDILSAQVWSPNGTAPFFWEEPPDWLMA